MKKIFFIHHATGWGGAPLNMINIINSLDKNRYQVEVLLLKNSIVSEKLKENNIPYRVASSWFYRKFYKCYSHTVPGFVAWYKIKSQIISWISWFLSINYFAGKELNRFNFDLVHLNSLVLTDWLRPCKKRGKVIIHIQEPLSKGYFGIRHRLFTNQMKKYADRIIAISEDNSNRINIPEKTDVIYNFVEEEAFSTFPANSNSKQVLYLGGQQAIKGFSTIVNSLQYLNNDIKVVFAGKYHNFLHYSGIKGWLKKHLGEKYKLLEKMRASDKNIEVGLTNSVSTLIKESAVLVSPFSKEHFSRPVIEAFACSRPAIGTNVEGMDEIIDHNVNGLIIEKNNPKALAEAINYLYNNPDVVKEMGNNGYKKAKKLFSPNNIKQFERIYDKILQ